MGWMKRASSELTMGAIGLIVSKLVKDPRLVKQLVATRVRAHSDRLAYEVEVLAKNRSWTKLSPIGAWMVIFDGQDCDRARPATY